MRFLFRYDRAALRLLDTLVTFVGRFFPFSMKRLAILLSTVLLVSLAQLPIMLCLGGFPQGKILAVVVVMVAALLLFLNSRPLAPRNTIRALRMRMVVTLLGLISGLTTTYSGWGCLGFLAAYALVTLYGLALNAGPRIEPMDADDLDDLDDLDDFDDLDDLDDLDDFDDDDDDDQGLPEGSELCPA